MKPAAAIALFGLSIASTQQANAQQNFEDIWRAQKKMLMAVGINEPLARRTFHWMQIQYFLGRCRTFVNDKDTQTWRGWWQGAIAL